MGGTTVIRSRKFAEIKDEYRQMFESAVIPDEHRGEAYWSHSKIIAGRERYEDISASTLVPWYVIGILHGMECGFRFDRHLFNGDPLTDYTKRYPPGYPKGLGNPPFTFEESAEAALRHDKLTEIDDWSLEHLLYRMEMYNGTRTRRLQGFATPYLWSFTNHYQSGKYKEVRQPDGSFKSVFDRNLVSKQCGVAASLRILVDEGHVAF